MSEKTLQNFYTIDPTDVIVSVDKNWDLFAAANDGEGASSKRVINESLWRFIASETVTHLYKNMIARVRCGATLRFSFRCDSPDQTRFFEMVISPLTDGFVKFETFSRSFDSRDEHESPDQTVKPLITCSWCGRVAAGDDKWQNVEDAIERFDIFEKGHVLSHGICTDCYELALLQIDSNTYDTK